MGKINRLITSLAKQPAPQKSLEIGTSSVGMMPSIFNEEFIDMSKVQIDDYKTMLDSDGTIQALYSTIVMPLLGANWTIEPDEETPAAIEQSAWVEESLRTPPHKGGMSTPFDLVIAQALRAVVEGYAGFEKVYDLVDGKIVYKKIAWRDPTTLTLRSDDRGGFNGLRQRAFIGTQYLDIIIPLERCWVYTYGKEFHNLKGRSAFTAAYSAYDKKRRLLYLAEQQAQNEAFKLKVVHGREGGGQDELDANTAAVDEVGVRATVGLPNGVTVETLNNNNGLDLLPLIEFQNAEMARSILAMFILLGTGSKTGSYALSQDQSDFFVQALMSIRKSLENHVTSYLIPDLYNYNFETPIYGTFKFEDITDSTIEVIKETFLKLTEKDHLPESVATGVVQKMADKLDIDVDLLKEAKQAEKDAANNPPPVAPVPPVPPAAPDIPPVVPPTPVNNSRSNLSLPMMPNPTGKWRREMTKAEMQVNFDGLNKKLDSIEANTQRALKPLYDKLVAGATTKLKKLIDAGSYDKITEQNVFDENIKNQYIKALNEASMEAYLYGKNTASEEMKVKIPATPKDSKDFFQTNAANTVAKQLSDLIFKIQSQVSMASRKNQLSKIQLDATELLSAIGQVFADYYDSTIGVTASAIASIGVNYGRGDVFADNQQLIYAYQYSAILDNTTCPDCEALDGMVLNQSDYDSTTYDPPIHLNCRCIWVEILADEQDPPDITGFPDASSIIPSLSKQTGRM